MQLSSRSSVPTAATCLVLATFLDLVMLFGSVAATQNHYIHWNTTNPIFRISNTDHIIDVNKGNNLFEYDQVTIICPNYDPNTDEDDAEKYIIYNVSREEYDTCRITDPNPRIIAVCDKPYKLMFFTITFRSFTPQPGGLEFRPGQDYYFISTSSSGDMLRRIGGRCSTHNMKVVFKVCCNETEKHLIQQDKPHLLHPEVPPMLPDYSVSPSPPTPSAPPRGGWRPVGHPTPSTARPAILHSYKGVQDLYDLHVPSINVKATTKKAEEYKNKNKHPNNIAKNEGLTSAAASPTARGTCSWRTCTLTTWCTSFAVFLLVRLITR